MKTFTILLCSLLLNTAAFAQDCPTKHAALTALDHASMEAAYVASFRGLYHRDPTGAPGSGPDDTSYWIGSYDHFGAYSDNICRAGWNAYTETRLSGAASADPSLGDQPARFLPGSVSTPPPVPAAVPPALVVDYSVVLKQILDQQQQILNVSQDTNAQVSQLRSTVGDSIAKATAFVAKYVAPAVATFLITRRLSQ